ncbi:enoyl-CoA hydratase-related protein [Thalassotalea euphylliae]|uniref:enoyl-CoA hydratase-related protein n=1 Tax=Thalassotalea euphylliae TaxID=1655234 RepID=UPI00362964D2
MNLPQLSDATLSFENQIACLTFNRHDVRNALTGTALIDDIVDTVSWVNRTSNVAVLIVTGAGSAFSAGGNIKDMAEQRNDFAGTPQELTERYKQGIQRIPLAMESLEVPAIAAINGPAIGAGFDLANMCDFRIASTAATFGETFINLGLIPGDGGAWFMQRLIGYQKAAELTFTGKIITAQQAQEYGLLHSLAAPEELMDNAVSLASEIASKPTQTIRMTKRLMKLAQRTELKDFLETCATYQGLCHHDPEHINAVEAMLSKMQR